MNELVPSLILYLGAKGEFDLAMLLANGFFATVIFLFLVFGRSAQELPVLQGRIVRFLLAAVYGGVAVRTWCGWYLTPVEPAEVAVNASMFWLVCLVRGDISLLVRAVQSLRGTGEQ